MSDATSKIEGGKIGIERLDASMVERIDGLLPQTQCTRCGYPGCQPYAAAIGAGEAAINQCPPGGSATIHALSRLLGQPFQSLNPTNGTETPPRLAWIDESRCIGCARCLAPCPVDAIVGAAKFLHTVIAERCTGCELCVAPCPVDCIELHDTPAPAAGLAALNRQRYQTHNERLQRRAEEHRRSLEEKKAMVPKTPTATRPS